MNSQRSPANNGLLNNFGQNMNNVGKNITSNLNNVGKNITSNLNKTFNTVNNTLSETAANVSNAFNTNTSAFNTSSSNTSTSFMSWHIMLSVFLLVVLAVIAIYWEAISTHVSNYYDKMMVMLGVGTPGQLQPRSEQALQTPNSPGAQLQEKDDEKQKAFVESVLPGRNQVFNISKNSFTYYDAEPLCKALGAELATYEQVKQAYAQGADWCNYGWVKGQMAVFPTQEDTWKNLQEGPEEQRSSCGRPGLNGGYFDNPELRYGVNCYGPKPQQSEHDAAAVGSGSGAPLTPAGLEFEKKVQHYRSDANNIAILPFNNQKWSG